MPTVFPSSLGGPKVQLELADGTPAVGGRLFFYVAGSVGTKTNTYTDSTGSVANSNPVTLNSLGMPTTEIWMESSVSYKVVYAPPGVDDPPSSPIFAVDNLNGIGDSAAAAFDQWVAGPAPTFISATQFSLVGDQTAEFHVGRRVKTVNTAGTIYSTITVSAFAAVTTITVVNDAGVLDAGLSAVSYGLISAVNTSTPSLLLSGGTLTGALTTTQLSISTAVGKIIPGATSLSLRNNADSADNLLISDAGNVTVRGTLQGPATMFSPITNSLGADVALNNVSNYFDGPSVAQGTAGTWFVSGTVTVFDTVTAGFFAKLWDGTTVIASCGASVTSGSNRASISLSGFITSPAGNLRISVRDFTSVNGTILFNGSTLSKDSTITAIRIA